MQNRSSNFGEEVADQVGIFLSVVTGFIVAQGWNAAIMDYCGKHKTEENGGWYPWTYAVAATIIALIIMVIWGYFVASKLYRPSKQLAKLRTKVHNGIKN